LLDQLDQLARQLFITQGGDMARELRSGAHLIQPNRRQSLRRP
jgi:hypothetical protein